MSTDYKSRLTLPLEGSPDILFTTESGLEVAKGYERIVIGGRGPYVEFNTRMMRPNLHIPEDQKYRLHDQRVYYLEFRTNDPCNVKVYFQKKTVGYADYRVGMWYITPFELWVNGKVVIEKLCTN